MMGLISPVLAILRGVPVWVWVVVAALAWGGFQHRRATVNTRAAEQAAASAKLQAAAADAERRERAIEAEANDRARRAADAYASTVTQARRAAAAAVSDRDRLRDTIAATASACPASAGASTPSRADAAAGLRQVLGECVGSVQALAEAADADAARVKGLQDYIRAAVPATGAASWPSPK